MASKKVEGPPDERIGGPPPPKTRSQEIIEQIIELQNQIRSLERELKTTQDVESLFSFPAQVPSDYPG